MKIAIAGGKDEADFLIGFLLEKKHKLIVINKDKDCCKHLASVYDHISVIYGEPDRECIMEEAGIRDFDVLIALEDKDADNLEICQMAKKLFSIKKTICTVKNPKNVEIFKRLGIDQAISGVYMLAQAVE